MNFRDASGVKLVGPARFLFEIPDGWQQGRSTFGGLVLGGLLRAIETSEHDLARVPRSVNAELLGAVSVGAADLEVALLRRGNRLSAWEARLIQRGEVVARLSAVLAAAKEVPPVGIAATLDDPPIDWRSLPVAPLTAPLAPVFTQHYAFRPTDGFPFSGQQGNDTAGWVAEVEPPATYDYPALLGLLDCFWPVSLAKATAFRPGATVSFMAEFFADPAKLDSAVPLYFKARAVAEHQGYCLELRELWSADRLIAMNQQLFLVIR